MRPTLTSSGGHAVMIRTLSDRSVNPTTSSAGRSGGRLVQRMLGSSFGSIAEIEELVIDFVQIQRLLRNAQAALEH